MTLSQSCCQDLGGKGKGPGPKAGGPGLQQAMKPKGGGHGDEELFSSTASYLTHTQHPAGTRALTSTTVSACLVTPWGLAPQQRWGA